MNEVSNSKGIYRKILIAIDDSPSSEQVALKGFALGYQMKAEMALVSVINSAALMTDGNVTPRELIDVEKKDFHAVHQMLKDRVFKDYKVWTFISEGKPYQSIISVAQVWEADLIVIGTHGRTGLDRLLMGSVAEHVIRHSTIPVLLIPTLKKRL